VLYTQVWPLYFMHTHSVIGSLMCPRRICKDMEIGNNSEVCVCVCVCVCVRGYLMRTYMCVSECV
jgi:hypothetical protein